LGSGFSVDGDHRRTRLTLNLKHIK
jgi:hypothetical protein